MPEKIVRLLLSHMKWDREELLNKLTSDDNAEFFKTAHVLNPFALDDSDEKTQSNAQPVCNICFFEVSPNVCIVKK